MVVFRHLLAHVQFAKGPIERGEPLSEVAEREFREDVG